MADQVPITVRPLPVRDQQGSCGNVAAAANSAKIPTAANAVHLLDGGVASAARRHVRAGQCLRPVAGTDVPDPDLVVVWERIARQRGAGTDHARCRSRTENRYSPPHEIQQDALGADRPETGLGCVEAW